LMWYVVVMWVVDSAGCGVADVDMGGDDGDTCMLRVWTWGVRLWGGRCGCGAARKV